MFLLFVPKVRLWQVVGDNLGLHSVLGFLECFSANYSCRFCRVHRNELKLQTEEDVELIRTVENYTEDLAIQDSSRTGIKCESVLNDLPYFHVTFNFCPDVMHDLTEGTCHRIIKKVVGHGINSEFFSIDMINYRIRSSNLGKLEKKNVPSPITQRYLDGESHAGQSASQMMCLIYHLPLWVGNNYPEDDQHWTLFLRLRRIMQIIFSPYISKAGLAFLRFLIQDFLSLLLTLTPTGLKPKEHYMLHYPTLISKVGPLKTYWAMRFEAKHRFGKAVAINSSNHKNTPKSVFHRNQLQLASSLSFQNFSKPHEFIILKGKEAPLPQNYEERFPNVENCIRCDQISFNGVHVDLNTFIIRSWLDEGPEIFKLHEILSIEETPYISIRRVKCEYEDHLSIFRILEIAEHGSCVPLTSIDVTSSMNRQTLSVADHYVHDSLVLPFEII